MATRFYLPANGISPVSPTFSASWEETASANRYMTFPFKTSTSLATTTIAHVNAAANDQLAVQYVSEPIAAATISGTVKGIIRVSQSAAANDCRAQLVIKIVSNDGAVDRGVLLAENASALSNEYSTSLVNRKFPLNWTSPGETLSSVDAQDNDRIVIEIGTRFHAATAGVSASYRFGDSAISDVAENETSTTDNNPWIEFSHDFTFNRTASVVTGVIANQYSLSVVNSTVDAEMASLCGQAGGGAQTTFYIMRGKDVDCGTSPPTMRTWTVTDSPDTTGAFYTGPKCGASALADIVVVKKVIV